MKYIITGGAGFIGSYFAEALLSEGKKVLIIDNLSTGSIHNLSGMLGNKNLQFMHQSIQDIRHWENIVGDGDVIIHLAATVGVNKVVSNALETIENNFYPTKTLLDVAIKHNCRFFFASTSEVYGELNHSFSEETDHMVVPSSHCGRSGYVLGKLMSEHYCLNYYRTYGAKVVVGRFFNVTGSRQLDSFGMVVPTFVKQALSGEPITVYGNGRQTRSFANVKDIIKGTLLLLENEKAYGEVFNIGADETLTIYELATYIQSATGSTSPIVFLPFPEARQSFKDIHHRKPCLNKMKSFTGWKCTSAWQMTIDAIIQHQKQHRQQVAELQNETA
jgi:UDP-glucose 4-epimerase